MSKFGLSAMCAGAEGGQSKATRFGFRGRSGFGFRGGVMSGRVSSKVFRQG